MIVYVGSFRALFTTNTISQRFPRHQKERRNDSERHELEQFNFYNIGRSSASLNPDCSQVSLATFDSALGKSSTFMHARDAGQNSHVDQMNNSSNVASNRSSIVSTDDHIYVRSEYSIYSETATSIC